MGLCNTSLLVTLNKRKLTPLVLVLKLVIVLQPNLYTHSSIDFLASVNKKGISIGSFAVLVTISLHPVNWKCR